MDLIFFFFVYYRRTPLMLAAKYHQSHLLTCLLTHGADVNAISANGWNAMFYAVCSGEPQVVRVLKRAGFYFLITVVLKFSGRAVV